MLLYQYVLIGLAAMAAGLVNALAGGGTLISFPTLTWLGIPAVEANVTNTVALVPGYLGATLAQLKDLPANRKPLWLYVPAAVIGGLVGGLLLLSSSEKLFRQLVPYLILFASLLLAVSDSVRAWLVRRAAKAGASPADLTVGGTLPIFLASIYGGYFGAGLSVIILATLGLFWNESLTRLNAVKQMLAFATNIAAASLFLFSGKVVWSVALIMAVCALAGGSLGGRLAGRIQPSTLRLVVVVIGVIVAGIYFVRG
ncbi:MAG TPA: sulfite exporter TauE/SafE family protein [Anaerolineaceae bacterium]|nr:sulfite exporter TauE/SafE family protein [Anaerolineaceae bacterium]